MPNPNEGEEWTVVNSKLRQKKAGISGRPLTNPAVNPRIPIVPGSSSSGQVKITKHERVPTTPRQPGVGRQASSSQAFSTKPEHKPNNVDKSKGQTPPQKETHSGVPANSKKVATPPTSTRSRDSFTAPKKSESGAITGTVQNGVSVMPSTSSAVNPPQTGAKTKIGPKSVANVINNVPPQAAGAAVRTPTSKKKKKVSKEEKRLKREEKFYQALYQNKDSHIQFVSADTIRKFQNDQSKPPSTKSYSPPKKNVLPDPPQFLVEAFKNLQLVNSPEEFPSLIGSEPVVSHQDKERRSTSTTASTSNIGDAPNTESGPASNQSIQSTPKNTSKLVWPDVTKNLFGGRPEATTTTPDGNYFPATPLATPKGRKSQQPMIIDVSSLIVTKEERNSRRKLGTPSAYGKGGIKKENFKITPGNPLDSSGPGVINRGKIRDKKKKPTKLKLSILKSRALRKLLLEERDKQTEKIKEEVSIKKEPTYNPVPVEWGIEPQMAAETIAGVKAEPPDNSNVVGGIRPLRPSAVFRVCGDLVTRVDHANSDELIAPVKVDFEKEFPFPSGNRPLELLPIKKAMNLAEIVKKEHTNIESESAVSNKLIELLDEVTASKIEEETPAEIEQAAKAALHTRKFRDYCDMYTSRELHRHVSSLLFELFRYQDRLYHTDPIKFKTKRRFVSGLKEAQSYLNLNKIQLLIIAPDIEKNPEPGGLDEKINHILTTAKAKGVPYVFSGTKYNLGKPMKIKTPISMISVLDKQNCEDTCRALMEEAAQLREKYQRDLTTKIKDLMTCAQ